MERITDTHVFFWKGELSNWYPCNFYYAGQRFNNSEQAFMWEKASHFRDDETRDLIQKESNPKHVKALGRRVKNFNAEEWMMKSYIFMIAVNNAKFRENERLKQVLLLTGDKTLVEASPYDKIWGIGLHWNDDDVLDETKWKGMNLLGKALMEVRKTIKEENEKNN